ncbi:hypothetical protein [uncultured Dysosmobacter sp.]|uniref:hypothetical protein n=1 Tax=uncultured Dysosmobacter sp. TaxID=2591384 RepID=UPI0026099B24|nr:hypothetical protein [uncultured Dysosmobacter sp.]
MRRPPFRSGEQEQIDAMIETLRRRSAAALDKEEFTSAVWLAYYEADSSYHLFEGCCDWDAYLHTRLNEAIEALKCERNRRMSVESRFSLNQPVGRSQRPAIDVLFPMQGDFTRGIDFWDYMERLGSPKYNMVRGFCRRDSDQEIMTDLHMAAPEFYQLKWELQADMWKYLRI